MALLSNIIVTKRREIETLPKVNPKRVSRPAFIESLLKKTPSLIAEVKLKSPSEGTLLGRDQVPDIVRAYETHASAISVLCDSTYFGSGYDLLKEISALTKKPLLAKEFIMDTKQIDHAAVSGASAVLMIARIASDQELALLIAHAASLDLDVLLELHDGNDLTRAIAVFRRLSPTEQQHVLMGINNRNLDSLTLDLRTTESLAPKLRERLPDLRCIVSESGIKSARDVERLSPFVDAFLIGTSLIRDSQKQIVNSQKLPGVTQSLLSSFRAS
jgi:indole-3-glycerol phosphate synthase